MIDEKKFAAELYKEFLEKNPKIKADDSALAKFAKMVADISTAAIAKYEREIPR